MRIGSSLVSALALGAALLVALLGGLSSVPDVPAPSPRHGAEATRIRIGVYDSRRVGDAMVAAIAPELPAIAQRAGVVVITARIDFESDSIETIDVSAAMVAVFAAMSPH